jgi:WD40 repeat protein
MGVVYKARQTQLKRDVALKVILAGSHASAGDLIRFRIEAEAVARLRHPGIVQIYHIGDHNGLPYFSLEYCAGGSLAERLAKGPGLRPKQAARLVQQLARAMHEAHEQDIVHRDLKPANILLLDTPTKPGQLGKAKITDFGLARRLDASVHTQTGSVMGTPPYMSPEQAGGSSRAIGPATDIYALGAILYELLTGRPPFVGASPLDTILQVINGDLVPPRQRRRSVPRDLEVICLKCLRMDPDERYDTADDLADDLRSFLDGEPIAARPVGPLERAVKWAARNGVIAGLAAAVLVLLVGLVVVWAKYRGAEEQRLQMAEGEKRLQQLVLQKPLILKGHTAPVSTLAFSPNGGQLISASLREAKFWDRLTGQEVASLKGLMEPLTCMAISSDCRRLASASQTPDFATGTTRTEIKIWNGTTDKAALAIKVPKGAVTSMAFSPDGTRLASASQRPFDGEPLVGKHAITIWDTTTGQPVLTLQEANGAVSSMVYSPDGARLAVASHEGTLKIWDMSTGLESLALKGHKEQVYALAYNPDGTRLASACKDWTVKIWDTGTGQELLTFSKHMQEVLSVAFSPDGRWLASGCQEKREAPNFDLLLDPAREGSVPPGAPPGKIGEVRLCDAATGEEKFAFQAHRGGVTCLAFSPDGKHLASGGQDKAVKVWDIILGND